MFESLKKKWKVGGLQLALIICTFTIGGSLTGYVGKKLMNHLPVQQDWLWTLIYIILITVLWPLMVMVVSVPLGQYRFFSAYIRKLGIKMGIVKGKPAQETGRKKHLAIYASGAGSNAQKIIDHFRDHSSIRVVMIVCNKPGAGVLNIAVKEGIPTLIVETERFFNGDAYLPEMEDAAIDLIVLAGFLWKVPEKLIKAYPDRILNIHPALLPDFGGKGMYGGRVHAAVLAAGKKQSGISIHLVDEHYDHGKVLFQAQCPIQENDTVDSLAERIHKLEHENYGRVIEEYIAGVK